jgi:hypothetical protein
MSNPRITVLMTVYNGMPYIGAAVESILSQTFTDFEFLIINDGSLDDSMAAVAKYPDDRIRVVENPENIGQTRSLNHGLQLARGELIARLDQDDIALPERLEKQVAFADANPQVAALGTAATIIDEEGSEIGSAPALTSERTLKWSLLFHNTLFHPSVMFRRSIVLDEYGGYDENIVICQDFDLWSRIAEHHALGNLPEPLIANRYYPDSTSRRSMATCQAESNSVVEANQCRILGTDNPLWRAVVVAQNSYTKSPDYSGNDMLRAFDEMQACFVKRFPGDDDDEEMTRFNGLLMLKIADIYARDRGASLEAFRRAKAWHPKHLGNHNVMRLFGLWLGGNEVRELWRTLSAK